MHVFYKGAELELVDIVDFLARETIVQVLANRGLELLLAPDGSDFPLEDVFPGEPHLPAVGIVHDLVDVVPVDQGDEVLGEVDDVLVGIHGAHA